MSLYNQKDIANSVSQRIACTKCFHLTEREELMKLGSMCKPCFDSYCRQAPAYMAELNRYNEDPKKWARRLLDREKEGVYVGSLALKFAKEVMKVQS